MATIQDLGKVAYFNKGAYNSETTYEINDVVSYNGSSYVSLGNENRGNLPTNATYWSVVASKGDKGDTGKPFVIEKTYESVEDMVADYDNMNVNDYVMISGNIEEQENATLWTKTETQVSPYKWVYLADFSGASGITGATPNIQIGNVTEGNEPAVTRRAGSTNENPILDFVLKTGAKGDTGATGNGIASVAKTGTSGLTDTYTITYTNTNTSTFDVKNGKGITNIAKTGTSGLVDTYTITYNDGTTSTFEITNGEDGEVTQAQLDETNEQVELANMVYNALPKVTGSGESITLDDTANTPLKLELKGNTYQYSTTGKNLFNANNYIQQGGYSGISIKNNEDGSYTITGTATGNVDLNLTSTPIILESGETYTQSITIISGTQTGILVPSFKNSQEQVVYNFFTNNQTKTTTDVMTLNNYDYYISNGTTVDFTFKVQLEKSASATSWEPYTNGALPNPDYPQDVHVVSGENTIMIANEDSSESQNYTIDLGDIELCKIGDYQDYFYKDNGKWYLHKEIGKVVFDGSESWTKSNSMSADGYFVAYTSNYHWGVTGSFANKNNFIINYFLPHDNVTGDFQFISSTGYACYLKINDSIANSVETLKTWLGTHNTIVYYVLATPTDTQITDTTLISQLNAVKNAVSYDTQTNISQENANKPFIITATAVKDLSKILDNLDARLSLVEE